MPPSTPQLAQRQKVVLVMDLVESVRLMAEDEQGVIAHWRGFVRHATAEVLPRHGGRLVKSLGDGIMVEFDDAVAAVAASAALHRYFDAANESLPAERRLMLRGGLHATQVYVDDLDIYGSGVNLAARVAALAGPGETMVTSEARDQLADGVDAAVEDMGECHLKHVPAPVRVWRVGPAGPRPVLLAPDAYGASRPSIAVIPLSDRGRDPAHAAIGELIADGIVDPLSRLQDVDVISQQSTRGFAGRLLPATELGQVLGAHYLLTGSYVATGAEAGSPLLVSVELADTRTGRILLAHRVNTCIGDWLAADVGAGHEIASKVLDAILSTECGRVSRQPFPTLESYTLLTGAIESMRRTSRRDFDRAHSLLSHFGERHRRNPLGAAWLAKWHVLNVEQGWAPDRPRAWSEARESAQRALDLDPSSSLALTIDGFVHCNLLKDFETASRRYAHALEIQPNNGLACLLSGMLHAFRGEGAQAVQAIDRARALSPLDPWRFFYESLGASAHLSAGNYERAIELARSSLRLNTTHVSTHRALTIALVLSGDVAGARQAAATLRTLAPELTVASYLAHSPGVQFGIGKVFAEALRTAGIPEH